MSRSRASIGIPALACLIGSLALAGGADGRRPAKALGDTDAEALDQGLTLLHLPLLLHAPLEALPTPRVLASPPTSGPTRPPATQSPGEPTARPTERPAEPTARPTERPGEPTSRPTERPAEPTARPTPTATRLAPPAGRVGARLFKSGPIQITADGRWVWVADLHGDSVSRIDTRDEGVRRFPLPGPDRRDMPRGLSLREDGREVWVTSHDADRVFVLDGESGALLHTIELPWGSGPYGIALSPPDGEGRQRWALVTLHRAEGLAIIDALEHRLRRIEPVFRAPMGIAWVEEGRAAWITHLFPDGEHSRLTRVGTSGDLPRVTTRLTAFAASPRNANRLSDPESARNLPEGGYLNIRGHPAELPAWTGKRQLWIPVQYHNMGNDRFTPDSTIQASVRRLNLETRQLSADDKLVLSARQVHDPTRGDNNPPWLGYGWNAGVSGLVDIGFASLGERLHALVVAEQSDEVVAFPWDTPPFKSRTDPEAPGLYELRVGQRPMGIAVAPEAPRAYVYNAFSFDVSVIDLSDPARPDQLRRIPVGPPVDADPLSDPTLLRGARLFHSAADPRVSAGEKVSCASCHINAEHDGRDWAFEGLPAGSAGQGHGPRSVPSMLGMGQTHSPGQRHPGRGWGQLHHSGDRDEIQDFEHTVRGPLMGGSGFLGGGMQAELGPANAGRDADLDALAGYLLALPPLDRSPHRGPDGGLSEAARRGATFFTGDRPGDDPGQKPADADCARCHRPETGWVDFDFHDVGQRRPNSEQELNAPGRGCAWCVNTLGLAGLWDTGPWNGVAGFVESGHLTDLVTDLDRSDRSARHGSVGGLSGRQMADLAAFLGSIDGRLGAAEVRATRDTEPPRIARVAASSPTRIEVWFSETVDAESAGRPSAYRIVREGTDDRIPVTAVRFDPQNGDRVSLSVAALAAACPPARYRLAPAEPIRDVADRASGNSANPMRIDEPANTHAFSLGDRLTVTLGASGYENLTVRVHDASPVGPGLATWAHDRVFLHTNSSGNINPGFLRFDWREAFATATGAGADAILDARFSLHPLAGDAQRVEARRVLQPWRDADNGGDWNQNPVGAPTWRDHSHPDSPWNEPGARALGGSGRDPADYGGRWDLAERVDVTVEMRAITEPAVFGGEAVTDAFRFWFAHPDLDHGYALRLAGTPGTLPVAEFEGWEPALRQMGPVLSLTYRLREACP